MQMWLVILYCTLGICWVNFMLFDHTHKKINCLALKSVTLLPKPPTPLE